MSKELWFGFPFFQSYLAKLAEEKGYPKENSDRYRRVAHQLIYESGLQGKAKLHHFKADGAMCVMIALAAHVHRSGLPWDAPDALFYAKLQELLGPKAVADWYPLDPL